MWKWVGRGTCGQITTKNRQVVWALIVWFGGPPHFTVLPYIITRVCNSTIFSTKHKPWGFYITYLVKFPTAQTLVPETPAISYRYTTACPRQSVWRVFAVSTVLH